MMDIGVIIPELAKYGGAERVLVECVARWQHKHKITLYASKMNEELLREHGISRKVSLARISPDFEGPDAVILNCTLLPKIWEQEIGRHDVYHTHLWPTHLIDLHPMVWYPHEPFRGLSDLRYNQPVEEGLDSARSTLHVYPKHTYDHPADAHHEAVLNAVSQYDRLGRPDRIVANSRYTASCLETVYQRPVTDVVYPGVNVKDFIHLASDENVILTIGQLWPHKRIRLAIEAIAQVEDVQLYIVGQGPEKDRLARMVQTLGVSDRVFFLQNVTNEELRILFSRSLAVVFTAVREPFGIVPLETLAAGKPLIAVNEGGYTEILNPSCAILVPALPGEIANAIRRLRDNRAEARSMGQAGIEVAKQHGTDRMAEELLAILEETHRDWTRDHRRRRPAGTASKGPLFGVQYYAWYGDGAGAAHWNDNLQYGAVTDMPAPGYYASSHGTTIEEHLRQLEECGVDFVVLNLHVDDRGMARSYERVCIDHIFKLAEERKTRLRFAVQVCFYTSRRGEMASALDFVRVHLMEKAHYFRFNRRPVLFVFWPGVNDGNKQWLLELKRLTEGTLCIAASLRMYPSRMESQRTFGVFDGFSLYSPLDIADEAGLEKLWREAYDNHSAGTAGLKIITLSPGYDDRHLLDPERAHNRHRRVGREDGRTYERMINFALSVPERPDMILVSTFNEYHENTHIEASLAHGTRYMDMTRDFIRVGRKQWKEPGPKRSE